MSNNKQIPTALEFLRRDESGVYNEIDIVQAMDGYAKLHVDKIKQFLHSEIIERRDYSASKMCEEVLKFIEQTTPKENRSVTGEKNNMNDNNNPDDQSMDEYNAMEEKWEMDNYNEMQNQIMEDMTVEQIAMMQLVSVLDDIQSMMHELALDERNELIDELTHLYERYNVYTQSRKYDEPE